MTVNTNYVPFIRKATCYKDGNGSKVISSEVPLMIIMIVGRKKMNLH